MDMKKFLGFARYCAFSDDGEDFLYYCIEGKRLLELAQKKEYTREDFIELNKIGDDIAINTPSQGW